MQMIITSHLIMSWLPNSFLIMTDDSNAPA